MRLLGRSRHARAAGRRCRELKVAARSHLATGSCRSTDRAGRKGERARSSRCRESSVPGWVALAVQDHRPEVPGGDVGREVPLVVLVAVQRRALVRPGDTQVDDPAILHVVDRTEHHGWNFHHYRAERPPGSAVRSPINHRGGAQICLHRALEVEVVPALLGSGVVRKAVEGILCSEARFDPARGSDTRRHWRADGSWTTACPFA